MFILSSLRAAGIVSGQPLSSLELCAVSTTKGSADSLVFELAGDPVEVWRYTDVKICFSIGCLFSWFAGVNVHEVGSIDIAADNFLLDRSRIGCSETPRRHSIDTIVVASYFSGLKELYRGRS